MRDVDDGVDDVDADGTPLRLGHRNEQIHEDGGEDMGDDDGDMSENNHRDK
jgi:hypothetical protein